MSADYAEMVVRRNRQLFADGVRDGMEIALRLLLDEYPDGGVPFKGEVPVEIEAWARVALQRIEEMKR